MRFRRLLTHLPLLIAMLFAAGIGTVAGAATSGQILGLPDTNLSVYGASGKNLLLGANAGTQMTFTSGGGVQVGSPTGGDKGAGTINATAVYVGGTAVTGGADTLTAVLAAGNTTGANNIIVSASQNVQYATGGTYSATAPEFLGPTDTDTFISAGATAATTGRALTLTAGAGLAGGTGGACSGTAGAGQGAGNGGAWSGTGGVAGATGAGGAATVTGGAGIAGAGGLAGLVGGTGVGADKANGGATVNAGNSTGAATPTPILFKAPPTAASSSTANTSATVAKFDKSLTQNTGIYNFVANATGGALATTATDGFVYVGNSAGIPAGTPTSYTGASPITVDTTNNNFYFYSGAVWQKVVGGTGAGITTLVPLTGTAAAAAGTRATAVGISASASNTDSAAFGNLALASGGQSVAVGSAAQATTNQSTAVGNAALATTGGSNTAVGYNVQATGAGGSNTAIGSNAQTAGAGGLATAIGTSCVVGGTASTGVGGSITCNNNDSVCIGFYSTSTATNQFVSGSQVTTHQITDVYFGSGTGTVDPGTSYTIHGCNANAAAAGGSVTIQAGSGVGSSKDGGNLIDQPGTPTGSGGANYIVKTGFKNGTATSAQTVGVRFQVPAKVAALSTTTATATALVILGLPTSNSSGGCNITYCIEATDGTNWDTVVGSFTVAASNKAGTVTATAAAITDEASNANSGTLTAGTTSTTVSSTNITIKIAPAWTVIVPTTVQATYVVEAFGIGATVTPQ